VGLALEKAVLDQAITAVLRFFPCQYLSTMLLIHLLITGAAWS
jgi:hypothetical protein